MGQVSPFLRRAETGHTHWCPACKEPHTIPLSWTFDGNVDVPTFQPSVSIGGKQTIRDEQGRWLGEWVRGPDGNAVDKRCHYVLTAGVLHFQPDCTHELKGQKVALPELPEFMRDSAITQNEDRP